MVGGHGGMVERNPMIGKGQAQLRRRKGWKAELAGSGGEGQACRRHRARQVRLRKVGGQLALAGM